MWKELWGDGVTGSGYRESLQKTCKGGPQHWSLMRLTGMKGSKAIPMPGEDALNITDKGFLSSIYKELMQINKTSAKKKKKQML